MLTKDEARRICNRP
jgi:hypothetical protein